MNKKRIYSICYFIAVLLIGVLLISALLSKDSKGVYPIILLLGFGTWGFIYLLKKS
jgi:hypothetical protein